MVGFQASQIAHFGIASPRLTRTWGAGDEQSRQQFTIQVLFTLHS